MRLRLLPKLLWLVPAIVFCLFRTAECAEPACGFAVPCGEPLFSCVDRGAEEARCRCACNSDLDFPTTLSRPSVPVRASMRPARGGHAAKRAASRPENLCGGQVGTVYAVSRYKRFQTAAFGTPVIARYRCRLCRLVI